MERAQNALADFDQSRNTIQLDQQKTQKVKNLADLETALRESDAAQRDAQARNDALQKQLGALAPRIVTQSRTLPNQYSAERSPPCWPRWITNVPNC